MTVREQKLALPLEEIREFCRHHPIRRLSLFGSILRDDFGEKSDVDFLVEFTPGQTPGLFKLLGMQYALQDMIGRTVDLRTTKEFSEPLRTNIMEQAEAVYARQE
ncbi:MAG TPA: nucleotidyltransferase family protein [Phycisphaerae bacterium]|jgi:hypothetical protein